MQPMDSNENHKNPVGRPLKFPDLEALEARIQAYFTSCKDLDEIPTISGLAVHLDTSRETLMNYEKRGEYFDTIKKAKDMVVALQEQLAMKGKINPTVWIFSAKNNLGYADKQELDHTSKGERIAVLPNEIHAKRDASSGTSTDSQ